MFSNLPSDVPATRNDSPYCYVKFRPLPYLHTYGQLCGSKRKRIFALVSFHLDLTSVVFVLTKFITDLNPCQIMRNKVVPCNHARVDLRDARKMTSIFFITSKCS